LKKTSFLAFGVVSLLILYGCGRSGTDQALTNVAIVEYSVDANGCLISQNAEAVINYVNGSKLSKTFIWNCATDGWSTQKQRYEKFFVSYDGGKCYSHYQTNTGAAICTERAVAPHNPSFAAKITSFDITPVAGGDLAGYQVNAQFTNTGNATIYDLYADYNDQYSFLHMGQGWLYTAPGATHDGSAGKLSQILPSKSFDVTVTLTMWDGSVLDTQTKSVTLP
jgi:hypothetical protein